MTPFRRFCILVWGPNFAPGQVAEALGVTRDSVRSWLKRDAMPASVAVEVEVRRLRLAVDLADDLDLDDEARVEADERIAAFLEDNRI